MNQLEEVSHQVARYGAQETLRFLQGVVDAGRDKRRNKTRQIEDFDKYYQHGYMHEYHDQD